MMGCMRLSRMPFSQENGKKEPISCALSVALEESRSG